MSTVLSLQRLQSEPLEGCTESNVSCKSYASCPSHASETGLL